MDTPETTPPSACAICGGVLPRLANGMQVWAVRNGERIHVPPCPLRFTPGELSGDDE